MEEGCEIAIRLEKVLIADRVAQNQFTHNVFRVRLDLLDRERDGAVEDMTVKVRVQLQEDVHHLRLV